MQFPHGGGDPGAVYQGRQEKDDNLALALAVGRILEQDGQDVIYTRTDDIYQTPFEKAQLSNAAGPAYFISFHRNSSPENNQYSGVETLVYDRQGSKVELAERINRNLEDVGFRNLGISERPGLVVLRRSQAPTVLIETGFINTDADNQLFDDRFQDIAQAIADAILAEVGEMSDLQDQETAPNGSQERLYRVQTGAFRNPAYAQDQLYQLVQRGYPAYIIREDGYDKVQVGAFRILDNAIKMENALRRQGFSTWLVS